MGDDTLQQCACNQQFTASQCAGHFITSSEEILNKRQAVRSISPYACTVSFPLHAFLRVTTFPAPNSIVEKFRALTPRQKRSKYHPIPIIHSLSPSTASAQTAISSLEEFLALADNSHRKTPMLWIGPSAAGHIEIRGRKGNQEIWDFGEQVGSVAQDNGVEVLGMWNMSVQASSWDGVRFGEKVALTQAMMVLNWLAFLESS
jgi:hypothetical protein